VPRHFGRALSLGLLMAASSSWAQQPQPTEEELVLPPVDVRGQRRFGEYRLLNSDLFRVPNPLDDYPQSVTVVPQELMREQADFTLREALRNVTGIGFQAGEGGGAQGDNLTLRGFPARTDIFLDGVRDVGSYTRDTFNLQAVEVFKGPSALLFGRGSTGGVINQVSKTPITSRFYEGSLTGGTGGFFRGQVDINQPIDSIAAFRFNAMGQNGSVVERDEAEVQRWGVAPSVTFGFGTPLQITASFLYQHENNLPDYGFPILFGAPPPIPPVDRSNFYGLKNQDFEETDVYITTLRVDYKYSEDFRLRNILRYGWYGRDALPSAPRQPANITPLTPLDQININVNRTERDMDESIVANNLDAVVNWSLFGFKSTLATGFELSYQTSDITRWTYANVPPTSLLNPNPFRQTPGMTRTRNFKSDADTFNAGVYAVNDLALTDWFRFIAGVRFDYFDADYKLPLLSETFSSADTFWDPRLGIVFQPTKNQMYYFTYGTSHNPSAEGLILAANTQNIDPEKNQSFEVGAKWTLFEKVGINASLFRIEKTNARTTDPITLEVELEGKQRVDGFEISLAGEILKGWSLFAGYTYLDPIIVQARDVQGGVNIQGKVLPNTPQSSATLWTTYAFDLKWPFQVGGGLVYVGKRYGNAANTSSVPWYIRGDMTAAVRPWSNFELRLNILNISNEVYFESIHPAHVIPGAGRTVLFTGTFSF
jgi:catecholate siderophore receptor